MRKGFTLIEVMVAVMIVSVVILGLLQLFANNTHIFFGLEKKMQNNQYLSAFLASQKYGFEDKKTTLYELFSDFEMNDDLRRQLKNKKVEVVYQELEVIDLSEFQAEKEETNPEVEAAKETNSGMVFEMGKSVLKFEDVSVSLTRVKLQ
ncbi:MAG: type II secretion system protein [Sulfurimonas sp.]|jgi:prepilin-type N-terminal cleavage/methylation domain-containing protein|nr:type II secretion system protein [Sulfurimonas sp.]MBU1216450.1 type II secretion system GspH family protein [bacterium]MBU1433459.1 type II secretion system GspH family protein [bacterium]MBU1503359.1 type II secretion system GspH family protein [bacterium]MBU3938315.1 type II secretion system GspH family protein [bacterium]